MDLNDNHGTVLFENPLGSFRRPLDGSSLIVSKIETLPRLLLSTVPGKGARL